VNPSGPGQLPRLPAAITQRLVPVNYAQIGRLLYGDSDLGVIKRISGWRRTDARFPAAVASGRSPTFDVKAVWKWLEDRQRSADGRTRESLSAMTELFSSDPMSISRRNLLLCVQAMKTDLGDERVRRLMMGLAALRRMAEDPVVLHGVQAERWFIAPAQAKNLMKRLLKLAEAPDAGSGGALQALAQSIPAWSWLESDSSTADLLASDVLALAMQCINEISLTDLAEAVDLALESEDGSPSPHLDASSTSGDAARLVGLIASGLNRATTQRRGRATHTVYDPTVGEGRLLSVIGQDRSCDWKMFGQDCDLNAVDMAAARLIAAGCEVDLRVTTDTLGEDQFEGQTFDLVVADPPLPPTGTGRSRRRLPEMGPWWQHITAKLAGPQARALILSTDQPGSQPPDEWLTSGHLLAVVETGQRMRRDVPGLTVLWVLKGLDDNDSASSSPVIRIALDPATSTQRQLMEADSSVEMLAKVTTEVLHSVHTAESAVADLAARYGGVSIRLVDRHDAVAIRPTGQRQVSADTSARLDALQAEAVALLAAVSQDERARWLKDLTDALGADEPA
jgi:hypothetical protein